RVGGKGAPADYIINWLAGWVEYFGIDGFRCDTAKHVELSRWNQLKNACKAALAAWRASDRADEFAKDWTDDFWMTGEAFGWDHGDTGYFTQGGFDSMINFAFNGTEGGTGRTPSVDDWSYYANFCNGGTSRQVLNYVSSHDTGLHRPSDMKNVATMLLLCPGGAQIYYGDETARPNVDGAGDAGMVTRGDFNWDAVGNDLNLHWQKIGQFRRRNPAVGAGTQTALGADTYGRKFSENGFTNAVAIRLNTQAGQTYTVSTGDLFADGTKVMDGYNMENTAEVSGGQVSMTASGPVLLIEEYGTSSSGPVPPTPPVPSKPVVTANPADGSTFTDNVKVTLSLTPATDIYYTLDGTTPSASSTRYTAPLPLTETTTVRPYASTAAGTPLKSFTDTLQ
ncbi:MAG: chitobiase/beta-hexosaminidase C-terminal domain-containing protein, partial [Muribaculaceae bacterium]|nr:chitobiase/beta-hexosaminidase C-terminal domain-containing protein [Muribaculaceae bacterium]